MEDDNDDAVQTHGVPDTTSAAVVDLCGRMDYTFIDIPDLVDSDEEDLPDAYAPGPGLGHSCAPLPGEKSSWPLAPLSQSGQVHHPRLIPPQPQAQAPQHTPPPQQHPNPQPYNMGLQQQGFRVQPPLAPPQQAEQPRQLLHGSGISGVAASAPIPAHGMLPLWASAAQQMPSALLQPAGVPGVAWSAEHQRLAAQQAQLVRPAGYGHAGPANNC